VTSSSNQLLSLYLSLFLLSDGDGDPRPFGTPGCGDHARRPSQATRYAAGRGIEGDHARVGRRTQAPLRRRDVEAAVVTQRRRRRHRLTDRHDHGRRAHDDQQPAIRARQITRDAAEIGPERRERHRQRKE